MLKGSQVVSMDPQCLSHDYVTKAKGKNIQEKWKECERESILLHA